MVKNKTLNIVDVVARILGHIDCAYETNYDDKSIKNMQEFKFLITTLAEELKQNYDYTKDAPEWSAKKLNSLYKATIEELLFILDINEEE